MKLQEQHIYGSARLGVVKPDIEMIGAVDPSDVGEFDRVRGMKRYELSNHLGNVLTVISDRKIATVDNGVNIYYHAEIISYTDYYPFGAPMSQGTTDRTWSVEEYRFGFQNQEEDNELWEGAVTYKYRIEDPRLGRFFSVDPLNKKYPFNSNYAFSENDVISHRELEGLEKVQYWVNDKCTETFNWSQVSYEYKEAFLRKHDVEVSFGSDIHPDDPAFANAKPTEVWKFQAINIDGTVAQTLRRYSSEANYSAKKPSSLAVFSGVLFSFAKFSASLDGSAPYGMTGEQGLRDYSKNLSDAGFAMQTTGVLEPVGFLLSTGSLRIDTGLDIRDVQNGKMKSSEAAFNGVIRVAAEGASQGYSKAVRSSKSIPEVEKTVKVATGAVLIEAGKNQGLNEVKKAYDNKTKK